MTLATAVPFALRRPWLLARDLLVRRSRPNLRRLAADCAPETFVWRILPHAARTFSACIALLPARLARASAVAYLYCRTLDTYEDLVPDREAREASLGEFARRFDADAGTIVRAAPTIDAALARDARDRAHVILVNRCHLVDAVFARLGPPERDIIVDLVRGMSDGMIWSSRAFGRQGGVLADSGQLARYCRNVLGLPTLFAVRLLLLHLRGSAEIEPGLHEDTMLAGEMIQLANVTRDIEKDLARGIAYHPGLKADLGRRDPDHPELRERIRSVREELLTRALELAPAYVRMAEAIPFRRVSLGRASTVLMLLFTDRYYRSCARRVGREPWRGPERGVSVLARSFAASLSPRSAWKTLRGTAANFVAFADGLRGE